MVGSVHGSGACMAEDVQGWGGGWHVWQGAFVGGGHLWQGGLHGRRDGHCSGQRILLECILVIT